MLEGKPENEIGYGGRLLPLEKAEKVITSAHVSVAGSIVMYYCCIKHFK